MKAKNIFRSTMSASRIGVLTVMTLLMSISCSDEFLNVVPEDRIDKSSFYSSAAQVLIGVNGVYAVQRNDYGNLNLFVMREGRSDNGQQNPNGQSEQISLDSFNETAGNLLVLDGWTNMYNTISLANAVIQNGPKATGDAALIARAIGEAKFLRALTYFNLVVLWGDVPLRTTVTDVQDATVARSSKADVYTQIIKDLTEAAAVFTANVRWFSE
ncbi:MAG: RagB/SusD family nutrient uptake outer membrane protein [Bacteroidota bacterium]